MSAFLNWQATGRQAVLSMGSFKSTPKKQSKVQRKSSPSNSEVLTQESLSTIKPPSEIRTHIKAFAAPKKSQQPFKSNKQKKPYNPNFHQQKEFFRQAGPVNSRRPAFKSGGRVDPYSPDVAPMNIFENQVIPIGIHNLSKSFRLNLATIQVLSLGMKFIPKTQSISWKNNFSNFEDFKRIMNVLFR